MLLYKDTVRLPWGMRCRTRRFAKGYCSRLEAMRLVYSFGVRGGALPQPSRLSSCLCTVPRARRKRTRRPYKKTLGEMIPQRDEDCDSPTQAAEIISQDAVKLVGLFDAVSLGVVGHGFLGAMQLGSTSGHMAYEVVAASAAIAFFFILAVAIIFNALLLHEPVASAKRNGKKTITSLLSRTGTTGSYNKYTRVVRSLSPRTLTKRLQSRSSGASVCIPQVSSHSAELSLPTTVKNPFEAQDKVDDWKKACCQWLAWDPNPSTRVVVNGWLTAGDEKMATRYLLGKRLAFGTSGLRGQMGAGFGRMNDLVVIQTSQGLCRYLEAEGGAEFKSRGVVIGHDHRAQAGVSSEGFADIAAAVFVSQGFRVYLLGGTVPTPLVAFGVSHLKACAGVMVTASHNPKMDNGYKVYWGNGSQIIPPHDKGIAASIMKNLEPWQKYNANGMIESPLLSDPVEALSGEYLRAIGKGLCRRPDANASSGLKVVYSAFHGVGDAWIQRAFRAFSLPPPLSVESQRYPHPDFPTLAYPNPEEPGTLVEAMKLAEQQGACLVLANDPDADRLAAAERQPSGEWHVFTGNDIGVLLGVWQWDEWRRAHPNEDPSEAVMIASTVSSKMLSAVAKFEGFRFEETMPGFKWMGHRAQELKARGMTILFAFEEALGFGPGDVVFEKDGLTSAALFSEMVIALRNREQEEMATRARQQGTTPAVLTQMAENGCDGGLSLLRRRLKYLHELYGEFAEDNGYVRCEDAEVVSAIFSRLRGDGSYVSHVRGYRVTAVRDLAEGFGYDSETPDRRPTLPLVGGGAHFLMFKLGDEGVVASLRTSGTEPKIKYYIEMQGRPGVPYEEVSRRVSEVAEGFVDECLQPERWGIKKVPLA